MWSACIMHACMCSPHVVSDQYAQLMWEACTYLQTAGFIISFETWVGIINSPPFSLCLQGWSSNVSVWFHKKTLILTRSTGKSQAKKQNLKLGISAIWKFCIDPTKTFIISSPFFVCVWLLSAFYTKTYSNLIFFYNRMSGPTYTHLYKFRASRCNDRTTTPFLLIRSSFVTKWNSFFFFRF